MRKQEPLTPQQAINYALRLLKQRSYSSFALQQKLLLKGLTEEESSLIVAKLIDWRLLDDARYAESMIKNETVYRKQSLRNLSLKLRVKGIDKSTSAAVMPPKDALEEQEKANARYHAEKYLKKIGTLSRETQPKLHAYLYRKGFTASAITDAVRYVRDLQNETGEL